MREKNILLVLLVCIFSFAIISGCNNQEDNANKELGIGMMFDYMHYSDEETLINTADTIIIGEVIKVNEPEKIVIGKDIKNPDAPDITGDDRYEPEQDVSFIFTVSEFKIQKVLKGDYSVGDIIKVKQHGGATIQVEDEEYFKEGSNHLLFLQTYPEMNIPASILNPYQGSIETSNDKIIKRNQNKLFEGEDAIEDIVMIIQQLVK